MPGFSSARPVEYSRAVVLNMLQFLLLNSANLNHGRSMFTRQNLNEILKPSVLLATHQMHMLVRMFSACFKYSNITTPNSAATPAIHNSQSKLYVAPSRSNTTTNRCIMVRKDLEQTLLHKVKLAKLMITAKPTLLRAKPLTVNMLAASTATMGAPPKTLNPGFTRTPEFSRNMRLEQGASLFTVKNVPTNMIVNPALLTEARNMNVATRAIDLRRPIKLNLAHKLFLKDLIDLQLPDKPVAWFIYLLGHYRCLKSAALTLAYFHQAFLLLLPQQAFPNRAPYKNHCSRHCPFVLNICPSLRKDFVPRHR